MIKRPFFAMLGLGAGIAIGIYVTRQARAAQEALKPSSVAARAVSGAGGLRERIAVAVEQGRVAAERREAELRTIHRLVPEPTNLGIPEPIDQAPA